MKRTTPILFLIFCLLCNFVMPTTAFAAGISDVSGEALIEAAPPTYSQVGNMLESDLPTVAASPSQSTVISSLETPTSASPENSAPSAALSNLRLMVSTKDGTAIVGAVFGLYRSSDDSLVEWLTTDDSGLAVSGEVPANETYYLLEKSLPEGCASNPQKRSITFGQAVIDERITYDLLAGSITVKKVDADAVSTYTTFEHGAHISPSPMSGAVFGIYSTNGQKLGELTIGKDGSGSYSGLPPAGYFLKELKAPEGYILKDDMIPFTISKASKNVQLTIENTKGYGSVKIIKSGEEGEKLFGVSFDLYRSSSGEHIAELVTDHSGIAGRDLPLGDYYLVEKSTAAGYALLTEKITFSIRSDGEMVELPITNPKKVLADGQIRLIKVDAANSGKRLSGAVFGIYHGETNEKIAELVTGSDGSALSPALPETPKGYYLKELIAPPSYTLDDSMISVSVKSGETTEVTIKNTLKKLPSGVLELIKVDKSSSDRLPDAVFGVYRASDESKVAELTTDKSGKAVATLPAGDYVLKELTAPKGYKPQTESIKFSIKEDAVREIIVPNEKVDSSIENPGWLKIIKKAEDGSKLQDALFGIYRSADNSKVAEARTDKNGEAQVELLEGSFYLKELSAPSGYQLLSDSVSFTIKTGETVEKTLVNLPLTSTENGSVRVVKKAESTAQLLEGAVFGVYEKSSGKKLAEITTNNAGEAKIELPLGDYFLKELRAPAGGYVLETAQIPFCITKIGAVSTVEVTNTLGYGSVRLLKVDEDGKPLSGAVFTLHRQDGSQLAELTTQQDGTAVYELPLGDFYLLEKSAPAGFQLDTQRYSFRIAHGKTAEVKAINQRMQGTIEIYFRHVQDKRELTAMKSYTDKVGADYVKWMREKGYENMALDGYSLVRVDYPTSYLLTVDKQIVTLWYDSGQSVLGSAVIPKTGDAPPYGHYIMTALSFGISAFCGAVLFWNHKRRFAV